MGTVFDRLDADQLAAVRLGANAAVSAGAGSGKTTVLAARYLRLVLEEGADVRSLLCLTFTRKAAAQMRERIYRELLASGEERARAQIERFSEAQISTIDSFCSLLLRSSAQDYGYAPDFAVDDERARDIAESEALAFLLERREEEALSAVFARLGFERVWKELFADVAYRLCSPAGGFPSEFAAMGERASAELGRLTRMDAASALGAIEEAGSAAASALSAAKALVKTREARALCGAAAPELARLLGGGAITASAAAAILAPFAEFKLGGFGRSEEEGAVKAAMSAARDAALELQSLAAAEREAPLSAALLGILGEFGERYRAAKRRSGVMSFRDAAVCAVDLLAARPEIRKHWKRRFRFVMIDEFQDDDELQRNLLYLLAEREEAETQGVPTADALAPDKLFFVGDEKQSIYRFRGADVSVFRRLAGELSAATAPDSAAAGRPAAGTGEGAAAGEGPASLGMNYRSEPALVAFFNELFSRVFADAAEDYEARFAEIGQRAACPGVRPEIRYLLKPRARTEEGRPAGRAGAEEEVGDDEAVADAVARYIRDSVGVLKVPGPDGAGPRPAVYEDFAILLRSTAKQYLIERFLRLRRIPYAVDDPRGLFLESPANDIYAALRLCLLDDPVAYATVLRSPLVRLSDDAFTLVLAAGAGPFDESVEPLLGALDLERFRRGRRILEALRSAADRKSAAELVSRLWYEDGLRLAILRKPDAHPYLEHFDYLLALAVRADAEGRSLASFVSSLEPLVGRPERLEELDVPREAASGVRLMTVHKAKGLEFPVVIVPGMEGAGQVEGRGAAWYLSPLVGVTVNLKPFDEPKAKSSNVFYDIEREREEKRRAAEAKRLFYVACTRAEAHLVFAGVEPDRPRGPSFHSFLSGTEGGLDESGSLPALPAAVSLELIPPLGIELYRSLFAGTGPRSLDARLPEYEAASAILRRYERRALGVAELNAERLAERGRAGEAEVLPECAYDDYADRVEASLFGELCHAALESALRGPGGSRAELRILDALPQPARAPLAEEARRLASRFLASELGQRAAAAPSLATEWSFLLDLGGGYSAAGRADLVFESGEEVYVIDFKSDRERRQGEYDLQLALYRHAAAAIVPTKRPRSFLFWLRDARSEEVAAEASEDDTLRWARSAAARGQPSVF